MLNQLVLEGIEVARSCSASDGEDQTPELAQTTEQSRRPPGGAEPQPLPVAPGPATFDAAALTLSVAAMPEHATTILAFRKPAGGTAQLAGISTTTSYTAAIINPPYRKINSDSRTRRLLREAGIETSNLYTGFLALAGKLLCATANGLR